LFGLFIGMTLVGALYRLIGDYFAARQSDAAILAVYAVAAWPLVNGQETIVALGLFGVFKAMLFFALVIMLTTAIQRRWATRLRQGRFAGANGWGRGRRRDRRPARLASYPPGPFPARLHGITIGSSARRPAFWTSVAEPVNSAATAPRRR